MAGETLTLTTALPSFHEGDSLLPRPAQIPGAWFFEVGNEYGSDSASSGSTTSGVGGDLSPGLNDFVNDDFQFRLGMNVRNVTETVEVPSSEHVAEIVGRQGCKIKALRAKTNTYIKTPVRGEEPVFVVTGRQEDVMEAKREIECAAEHFTQIRASRRHSQGGAPAPGHVTAYVRVPLRVVGLVVGPKGATIKRIQQDTHTYIITPSREREPIFEVTGLPQNVDAARREIEQHIYQRTGNMPITDPSANVSSFDFQAAAAAACRSATVQTLSNNRPNYGALAAGTHELRKAAALEEIAAATKAAQEAASLGDAKAYSEATNAYHTAVKVLQQSVNAQAAAASQLGVAPPAPLQVPSCTASSNEFSNRNSPLPLENVAQILSDTSEVLNLDLNAPRKVFELGNEIRECVASASNSTRGSSPTAPLSSGSLASLHNNNYNTWASADNNILSYGLNGSLGGGMSMNDLMSLFNQSCGLSSTNSGSRDEGLGDSPTNSLSGDPYHLMMSSIWNDLDSQQSSSSNVEGTPLASA